jgi:hypothetical protein
MSARVLSSPGDVFYVDGFDRLTQLPDAFIPGPFWKTWPAFALVLVGFFQGRRSPRRGLLFVGFLFLMLAMVLPRDFLAWQYAGWRFLPVAAVVGWAFLRVPSSWPGRVVVVAVAVAQLGWSAWFHLDQREKDAPFLQALEKIPPAPMFRFSILRVPPDNIVYEMNPFIHFAQMVTMRTGGSTYYGHQMTPAYHWILLKDGPLIPEAATMAHKTIVGAAGDAAMSLMMTRAARFDGLVYYGYPEEADYLRKIGYQIVFQEGGLIVADLVGCPVTLSVHNVTSPVTVAVGFENGIEPLAEFTLTPGADTSYSQTLDRVPCGRRWLSVSGEKQGCAKSFGDDAVSCALTAPATP